MLIFVITAKVTIEINKTVLMLKNGIKFSESKNNDEIENVNEFDKITQKKIGQNRKSIYS